MLNKKEESQITQIVQDIIIFNLQTGVSSFNREYKDFKVYIKIESPDEN